MERDGPGPENGRIAYLTRDPMPHASEGMKRGLAHDADRYGLAVVMVPIFGLTAWGVYELLEWGQRLTGGGVPRGVIILSFMFLPAGAAVAIGLPLLKRLGHPFTPPPPPPPWAPPPPQD
ncbi:hypothetical protein SAMN02745194_03208 [Roseomonas rosea]|uniref:Uncharacterized protein n=1 Tax=Muricoccus roseus TaxID=198092 RepID=A0A1M6LNT1_9PROT|nr:hypothetical protein [Roseomonas rosea]SHJ72861.1 hypothetical protein SAMN02745194_03208 [Roseomonas rosea]